MSVKKKKNHLNNAIDKSWVKKKKIVAISIDNVELKKIINQINNNVGSKKTIILIHQY